MSKPTPFKPETGTISGFGNYLFQNFENSIANTNVALSGYNSYMTNSYNRSSNITRDTQTGDKTFENTTINENLNASNVMNPFGIPAQLYNVYVNYMKNVNTSALGEEKVSDNMDGEINAGVRRVGNLYVIFHENSDKENGVWKTKNVTADAYVRRDEGWYRVYFRNDRNGQDVERGLNNRLTEKYAEFSTAFSPSVLVRGGIEQQQQVEQTMALTLALPQNATATDVENLFKGQNIPLKNSSDYAALLALADNGLSNVEGADGKTYKVLRKGNDLQVNSYDETVSRMAFFIGTEIKAGDKRLAVLGIKTPGDNKAAFGSLEVGKTKPKQDAKGTVVEPEEPKIVTLGWMDMTHSEPQFNGYSSVQQPQLPINVQNPSATDSRFIKPKDDIFLASYQVVDRFYGMIMGGGDVAGGVARGRHWGAGAVAQYDGTGVTRFMGNGMVSSEFVDASGFMSAGKGLYPSYGGVATIKNVLKKNWNVVISALVDANIPLNQIKDTASLERILTDFQTLTQEMETETSKPGWQDETKNAQYRADRTADWSRRSIDILERMRVLVPSDILGDIRTEFSVALETGKTVHKISLSQVTGQDNVSQGNYVVTMHSVNFGEKTSVSLVAGVRAYETNMGQPPSPTQVPLPDNFGGMRFKYDSRTSFGYTTYNLFSSNPQAHVFTVAHDFNSANSLKTMLNLKIIPKEGQDIDFYIGNTKFRAKAEYDNLNTMKSVNVAGDYNIGKAIGATLPIFAGGGIRYTDAGQLKMIEPRLHIGSSPSDRISFDVEAGWLHGWTSGKSGRYDTATGTITLRWRF